MTLKKTRRRIKIGPGAWKNLNKNGGVTSTTYKSKNQTFTQKRDGAIHTTNYGGYSDVTRSSYRPKKRAKHSNATGTSYDGAVFSGGKSENWTLLGVFATVVAFIWECFE